MIQGQTVTIPFVVHNTTGQQAYLNAWIDFNGDGQWSDSEQIAGTPNSWMTWNFYKVSNGVNYLTFTVPADADARADVRPVPLEHARRRCRPPAARRTARWKTIR